MTDSPDKLYVCWTTVANEDDARRIAKNAIETQHAACVQIDGPIRSYYHWEGNVQNDPEYRLTFKVIETCLAALEESVKKDHPYETPQWIAVEADKVSEKYLKWAKEASSFSGFL